MSGYHKKLFKELAMGDFGEEEMSTAGVVGNVAVGFIPIVGQIADARDTAAAVKDVFKDPTSGAAYAMLGIALIGWLPGGDVLKTLKYSKKLKKGRKVSTLKKIKRSFIEDRKTFNASKDFFKRYRNIFGKNHGWSLEHSLIKQRWYRSSSKNPENWSYILQKFPPGTKVNRALQKLGDAGWNLVPVPKKMNTWLYHHKTASAIFNVGTYAAAGWITYTSASKVVELGTLVKDQLSQKEKLDTNAYTKKIKLD